MWSKSKVSQYVGQAAIRCQGGLTGQSPRFADDDWCYSSTQAFDSFRERNYKSSRTASGPVLELAALRASLAPPYAQDKTRKWPVSPKYRSLESYVESPCEDCIEKGCRKRSNPLPLQLRPRRSRTRYTRWHVVQSPFCLFSLNRDDVRSIMCLQYLAASGHMRACLCRTHN